MVLFKNVKKEVSADDVDGEEKVVDEKGEEVEVKLERKEEEFVCTEEVVEKGVVAFWFLLALLSCLILV